MTSHQQPPRVTAILATYNRTKYLSEAIESILNQSVPLELIVVDDGSDVDPATALRPFEGRLTLLRKENGGRATALNLGLQHARGDWIWFFDDDDVALPDAVERLLKKADEDPSADFVFSGNYNGIDGPDGRIIQQGVHLPIDPPSHALMLSVLQYYDFRTQGMLIRRRCIETIGPFDPAYLRSQDYEFIVRLLRGFRGVCLAEPTFIWRYHPGVRGPKGLEHDESQRDQVWLRFDGMLGKQVRESFKLGEFLVPRVIDRELTDAERRAALINRMAIMASKGLVAETLQDAIDATDPTHTAKRSFAPLTPKERRVCKESVLHRYFLMSLKYDPQVLWRKISEAPRTPALKEVAGAFSRGLLYAARSPQHAQGQGRALTILGLRLMLVAGVGASLRAYIGPKEQSGAGV